MLPANLLRKVYSDLMWDGIHNFICRQIMPFLKVPKCLLQVELPRHLTRNAVLMMKRFCRDSPVERLGYQKNGISDIKKHKWFQVCGLQVFTAHLLEPLL